MESATIDLGHTEQSDAAIKAEQKAVCWCSWCLCTCYFCFLCLLGHCLHVALRRRQSHHIMSASQLSDGRLDLQGVILPSVINITSSLAALTFSLSLSAAPGQDVQVSIQSPTAAWNPSQALALISPGSLLFEGVTWNTPQQVSVSPAAVSVGDFFLSLTYRY